MSQIFKLILIIFEITFFPRAPLTYVKNPQPIFSLTFPKVFSTASEYLGTSLLKAVLPISYKDQAETIPLITKNATPSPSPIVETAYGSDKTPTPKAVAINVNIDPLTEPWPIGEKVLSNQLLFTIQKNAILIREEI